MISWKCLPRFYFNVTEVVFLSYKLSPRDFMKMFIVALFQRYWSGIFNRVNKSNLSKPWFVNSWRQGLAQQPTVTEERWTLSWHLGSKTTKNRQRFYLIWGSFKLTDKRAKVTHVLAKKSRTAVSLASLRRQVAGATRTSRWLRRHKERENIII